MALHLQFLSGGCIVILWSQAQAVRSVPKKLPGQFPCIALTNDPRPLSPPLFPQKSVRDLPKNLKRVLYLHLNVPGTCRGPRCCSQDNEHTLTLPHGLEQIMEQWFPSWQKVVGCSVRPGGAQCAGPPL